MSRAAGHNCTGAGHPHTHTPTHLLNHVQTEAALNDARAKVATARSAFEAARQRVSDGVTKARADVDAAVANFNRVRGTAQH